MGDETPPIVKAIWRYYPDWKPPKITTKAWVSTKCPFHGDDHPSASVSFRHNAFKCFVCGVKGDAIAIIRSQEEVDYSTALRISEELSPGSHGEVQSQLPRQPGRRVFGEQGAGNQVPRGTNRHRQVPSRVRGRPAPWT